MAKSKKTTAEKRREMAQRPDTDPYEVLGVARNADEATIKSAYRKKAQDHHPDKHGGDEEKFKEVAEAYDVLSDPEKRELFDLYGNVGPEPVKEPESARSETTESYEERYQKWQTSQPKKSRGPMDGYEKVYVGDFNGVPHYHFGPVTVCAGCGLGLGEMGPVDEVSVEATTGLEKRTNQDTLPGAAFFKAKK